MPETPQQGAIAAAERIRAAVEQSELDHAGTVLSITTSIGAITCICSLDDALNRADRALYQAKREGRNRVVMASLKSEPAV